MKRLKYIAFTVLLASFSLQSCDLERYPLTDLSEDNFWTDDKNAELALTSLYRGSITNGLEYSVSDFWSYHGMLFMEHLTDNAYDRRGENNPFFNISSGKLLNNNSFIKNYWSSAYKRIGLCNRFLECCQCSRIRTENQNGCRSPLFACHSVSLSGQLF